MDNSFSDLSKFRKIQTKYGYYRCRDTLNSLKRGELTDAIYKNVYPKHPYLARVHGLLKLDKDFDKFPSSRSIINTTKTAHYFTGKCLLVLLNALTHKKIPIKNFFVAANRITILLEAFKSEDCTCVSIDIISLFTNAPLMKTVSIV